MPIYSKSVGTSLELHSIRYYSLIILLFLSNSLIYSQKTIPEYLLPANIANSWVATDALGRKLPVVDVIGERKEKFVALFFWPWHTMDLFTNGEPVNIQKIVSKYPEAANDYTHPAWKKNGRHHWSESIFGYYLSTDKWVLRKQAIMLADAGVDVVFFDTTNKTFMWDDAIQALGEEWTQARKDGIRAPCFVFMTPFSPKENSKELITKIYKTIYKKNLYKDLWFIWDGKPLIMGYPNNVENEIKEYFTFRPGQPSYRKGPTRPDQWGWLEVYPQNGYVEYAPNKFEEVCVGVAQNATDFKAPAAMNDTSMVYGRSFTSKNRMDKRPDAVNYGLNFQEQWDRALKIDPKLVFVTGWNEWTAGRYKEWQGTKNAFPDEFNQEFSRDIEPMKGGHGDNYYYQLIANIRKFKGIPEPPLVSKPMPIVIDGDFSDWKNVQPTYFDHKDFSGNRDHKGYGSTWYKNYTERNDFIQSKVSTDIENIYFMVETVENISKPTDKWMMLFIDIDQDKKTGWEGYDYVINRKAPSNGKAFIEKCDGGWNWTVIGSIDFKVDGNKMELKIPKSLIMKIDTSSNFEFKWSDNMKQDGDIMDFYINGDVAPDGRFNYVYSLL